MRLTVCADKSCPVNGKDDREFLETDIRGDLIIGALQEGGINSDNRLHAPCRQSGSKCHSVLFRDPDVKKAVGVAGMETLQADAVLHGCRDAHQGRFLCRQMNHRGGKSIRVGWLFSGFFGCAGRNIEGRCSMEL